MRRISLIIAAVALTLLIALPAAAMETCPETGAEYGAHVSEMARQGHLSGEHNPGMHRGLAGVR